MSFSCKRILLNSFNELIHIKLQGRKIPKKAKINRGKLVCKLASHNCLKTIKLTDML